MTTFKLQLGQWAEKMANFLIDHYGEGLANISESIEDSISAALDLLQKIPPSLLMVIVALLILALKRKIPLAIFSGLGLWLIAHLGLWKEMLETVVLVGISTFISAMVGIPLGILAAKKKRFYSCIQPLLDLMQTIPTFVYLIPTLMIFGLGLVPGIVSTVIFALPAPIRLTYLGFTSVPPHLIELGHSFGTTQRQLLFKIEWPYAWPMISTGISQCIMLSLSMVVMAALVGADGLGKPVIQALNTVNIVKGFEAGFAIVIVAIVFDRILKKERVSV